MPVTKSAIKKLRQDKKRTERNRALKNKVRQALRKVKKQKSERMLWEAFSLIDRAVNKNIFHKNRAARLKSKLSKLVPKIKVKPKLKKEASSRKGSKIGSSKKKVK